MFMCNLIGLIRFVEEVDYINISDTGYLYAVISLVLSTNNNSIIIEGKTDIPSLIKIFKVKDRTNVIRILDRLVDTGLLKYKTSEQRGNQSVYITVSPKLVQYFFQK
jgi:hypothetical protein